MEQEKTNTQKIADFADKSLLIVDDDNPLRDRLSRAMEKKGFQVTQAESVEKGIIQVKKAPPAFAVVDLRLNDGNGLEVVKEIQRIKKNSRISQNRINQIDIFFILSLYSTSGLSQILQSNSNPI